MIRVSVEWLSGDREAGLRRLYAVCLICRGYPAHPVLISLCDVGECKDSEQLNIAPYFDAHQGGMLGLSEFTDTGCKGLGSVCWLMMGVLRFIFPFFERWD